MSDRLQAALEALAEAIRAEIAAEVAAEESGPQQLYSCADAARWLGIGRSTLFGELASGRLKSFRVGRRRLIPAGALDEYVADQIQATKQGGAGLGNGAGLRKLPIPQPEAGRVATRPATANARSVARRSQPEYTANVPHIPRHRTPAPRDAA